MHNRALAEVVIPETATDNPFACTAPDPERTYSSQIIVAPLGNAAGQQASTISCNGRSSYPGQPAIMIAALQGPCRLTKTSKAKQQPSSAGESSQKREHRPVSGWNGRRHDTAQERRMHPKAGASELAPEFVSLPRI